MRSVLGADGVAAQRSKYNGSLEEDHGVERRAAQRAARRPLLPPRAHGLDDALPAAAGVAARLQLAVRRARQAHDAQVPVAVVGAVATALDFAGPVSQHMLFYEV